MTEKAVGEMSFEEAMAALEAADVVAGKAGTAVEHGEGSVRRDARHAGTGSHPQGAIAVLQQPRQLGPRLQQPRRLLTTSEVDVVQRLLRQ